MLPPFAAAAGTASDAASAAKLPLIDAAAGDFVVPTTIAAIAPSSIAAAEDVGGAWEAGRARVRGVCAGARSRVSVLIWSFCRLFTYLLDCFTSFRVHLLCALLRA